MKKYIFLLTLMFGVALQAQQAAKSFNAEKYAKNLTEKILAVVDMQNEEQQALVERVTFSYAKSIEKHILLYEQQGRTEGKSLEEIIEMVKNDAKSATKFERQLGEILGAGALEKLKKNKVL